MRIEKRLTVVGSSGSRVLSVALVGRSRVRRWREESVD